MKFSLPIALIMTFIAVDSTGALASPADSPKGTPILRLADTDYLYRWSKAEQHEFTPRDQADLKRWSDMITINYYRAVKDGDGLASTASAVLENYTANQAMVLKTSSVPRTPQKPAEHLIVVLFPRPEFIEAVFARFKIAGTGAAVIYSHREYGAKVGDQMSAWLKKNGPVIEKAIMAWDQLPAAIQPKQ
jgi:hypothetical protein